MTKLPPRAVIGTPNKGRSYEDIQNLVGSYVRGDQSHLDRLVDKIYATGWCVWHTSTVVAREEHPERDIQCPCSDCDPSPMLPFLVLKNALNKVNDPAARRTLQNAQQYVQTGTIRGARGLSKQREVTA